MIRRSASFLRNFALPAAAAFGLWVLIISRVTIHFTDAPAKTVAESALTVALIAGAYWMSTGRDVRRGQIVACAILAALGMGEVRRVMLRYEYGASADTDYDFLNPVTTTDLAIRHFQIELPSLGESRLRVVHVTDLHVSERLPWSYFVRLQSEIRDLKPDIIVMTGDYVSSADRVGLFERWLAGLPRPTVGAFATLGNHDYWMGQPERIRDALAAAGVTVLSGKCTVRAIAGASIRLCGTEEPWGPGAPVPENATDMPTIVLTHTPDNVYALHDAGANVIFAGHTHGGQIRLPWLGAVVVPSRYGRRFDRGHFVVDGSDLFVSAGLGADDPAIRLWCRPELVAVDLVGREPSTLAKLPGGGSRSN